MLRLLLLCFPFYFSAQFALQTNLLQLVNDPQLKGTKWSVCAIDLNTGDTLAAYDAAQQLPGASIVKLVSTAAALNILGPEHRAQTQLSLEGQMKEHGVWDGNLYLVGGGDVSLGSRFFNASGKELAFLDEWVAQLQSKGIQCINGAIIADGSSFGAFTCPLGWQQLDMGNYYGCGAFGLNFYDNTLKLNFQTGQSVRPSSLKALFQSRTISS
jgi:D-alanyl-D-alanine carboxypeptidase/D-alanyl-D-alanine-endopeptidase (penicillin-binding protein 4)